MTLLNAHGLGIEIGGKTVCRDMALTLAPGQCWVVLGRNGAGKSTLLHTLAGLRTPAAGEVLLEGKPLTRWPRRNRAQRLGLLLQHHEDPFPEGVLTTALLGRYPHLGLWQREDAHDEARARAALAAMDLAGMESRLVSTLSGGERQRLAIAQLLVQDPAVLLLDEPVNHLDLKHQIDALDALTQLARVQGRALMMVLHDVNLALRYGDHALLLHGDGDVAQGRCAGVINEESLQHAYGHAVVRVTGPRGDLFVPA